MVITHGQASKTSLLCFLELYASSFSGIQNRFPTPNGLILSPARSGGLICYIGSPVRPISLSRCHGSGKVGSHSSQSSIGTRTRIHFRCFQISSFSFYLFYKPKLS